MKNCFNAVEEGDITVAELLLQYVPYGTYGSFEYTEETGLVARPMGNSYKEHNVRLQEERTKYLSMSNTQIADSAYAEYIDEMMKCQTAIDDLKTKIRNIEPMLSVVNEWTPPTAEHAWVKDGLVRDLVYTLDRYKSNLAHYQSTSVKEKDPGVWLNEKLEDLAARITYNDNQDKTITKAVKDREVWIAVLKNSLPHNVKRENW